MKAVSETKAGQTYTYKSTSKDGKDGYVVVISEGDTGTNESAEALNHIEDMKKKGALFFYDGKSINSAEAIKYIETVKALYISTKKMDTKQPKVYISTMPTLSTN